MYIVHRSNAGCDGRNRVNNGGDNEQETGDRDRRGRGTTLTPSFPPTHPHTHIFSNTMPLAMEEPPRGLAFIAVTEWDLL